MNVQGRDCTLAIKTTHRETDIPYSEETIREAISLLEENPPIEGTGTVKALPKNSGVKGCIVTPITIGTAPLLFFLAMGELAQSDYVPQTRDLYKHWFHLVPQEDTEPFGLVQHRGGEKRHFPSCRIRSFELRILRGEALKLKLDIRGEQSPVIYPYLDEIEKSSGERFNGDNVKYLINGQEYKNIYGFTLSIKKEKGVKTELWIKRVLKTGDDIPAAIDELTITARLLRDKYENRHFGTFRLTFKNLLLFSDETTIDAPDAVIGPLRYFVNGGLTAEAFSAGTEDIA